MAESVIERSEVVALLFNVSDIAVALRAMLELPFEHVIVSHGEPVHDRAAFERALDAQPWAG